MGQEDRQEASDVSPSGESLKGTTAQGLMAVTGFAGTVVFANLLSPAALGSYYLLFAITEVVVRPVGGLSDAVKKRLSESDAPEDTLLGTHVVCTLGWLAILGLATIVLAGPIDDYVGIAFAWVALVALIGGEGLFALVGPILHGRGRIGATLWIDALRSVLTLPLQVGLLLLYGVYGVVAGLALASVAVVPVGFWLHGVRPQLPSREVARRVWSFARYSVPTSLAGKTYERLDPILIGFLLVVPQPAVADYGVAARVTIPGLLIAYTVSSVLLVRVSNIRSKAGSVDSDVSNALGFVSILAVPLVFGAAAVGDPLVVTLFSERYADATILVVGLALARLFNTQIAALGRTLGGLDLPRYPLYLSVGAIVLNVALGIPLILEYGALGAVVATVTAEGLKYVAAAALVKRELPDVDLFPQPLRAQIAAGAAMAVLLSGALRLLPVRSWVEMSVHLALGTAVYGGLLLLFSSTIRVTAIAAAEAVFPDRLP